MEEAIRDVRCPEEIELRVSYEPTPFTLWTDRWYLQHVMMNLLSNASDACEADDRITIRACLDNAARSYDLTVSDTGCGIMEEDLSTIFEPLYSGKVWGTGLGLSLCKQLVEQLGGGITLSSQVDQGTTVRLRLPMPPPSAVLMS